MLNAADPGTSVLSQRFAHNASPGWSEKCSLAGRRKMASRIPDRMAPPDYAPARGRAAGRRGSPQRKPCFARESLRTSAWERQRRAKSGEFAVCDAENPPDFAPARGQGPGAAVLARPPDDRTAERLRGHGAPHGVGGTGRALRARLHQKPWFPRVFGANISQDGALRAATGPKDVVIRVEKHAVYALGGLGWDFATA